MPIHPSQKHLYPPDWKYISARIRFVRAENRCEFCKAENYKPHPITGSKVVLTVMHLDHDPTNCIDDNLKAACQRCHNIYDNPMRRLNAKTRKRMRTESHSAQGKLPVEVHQVLHPEFILRHQQRFSKLFTKPKKK